MTNMKTPICEFAEKYKNSSAVRLHMPGHKGNNLLGVEDRDITEITGADVLYSANGIIKKSEESAAKIFGTAGTFYSTEGSSLCIRAMVYLMSLYGRKKSKKPLILAARNAHKSFISAAATMNIKVKWLFGEEGTLLSFKPNLKHLEAMLKKLKPAAVYITSPDYLGNMADIRKIADLCHKFGAALAVDNAHGAYLKFCKGALHPTDLGADICCDSAHKTLPVLTGGAYLHISKTADELFLQSAENALSLFASTSPSYLILQSLDKANEILVSGFKKRVEEISSVLKKGVKELKKIGFTAYLGEPLKLTLCPKDFGYTGGEIGTLLEKENIFPEFCDPDFVVLMFSAFSDKEDVESLVSALCSLPRKGEIKYLPPKALTPKQKLSPSKAVFSLSERVEVKNAKGRVLALPTTTCPPAVPILVPGEQVSENAIKCFEYYGIKEIFVVK